MAPFMRRDPVAARKRAAMPTYQDSHYFAFAGAQVDYFAGWWLVKKSSRL